MVSYKKKFLKYKLKYEKLQGGSNHNINCELIRVPQGQSGYISYTTFIPGVASFSIDGEQGDNKSGFDVSTMYMSIYIEEEYRSQGLAKKLIKKLCECIKNELYPMIRNDQLLFIDTDASWEEIRPGVLKSFWEHIGMKPSRMENITRNVIGAGYEKFIDFQSLCNYANADVSF